MSAQAETILKALEDATWAGYREDKIRVIEECLELRRRDTVYPTRRDRDYDPERRAISKSARGET